MPALSKASLKALWTNFFQPTSADFADLISSWTDYYAGLETLGAAVSGGSTGLANFSSPTSISFISVGATGSGLISTSVASSARSVLGLGTLAVLDSVSAGNVGTDSVGTAAIIDQNPAIVFLCFRQTQTVIVNAKDAVRLFIDHPFVARLVRNTPSAERIDSATVHQLHDA